MKLCNVFPLVALKAPNPRGLKISLLLAENKEPCGSRTLRRWMACGFGGTTLGVVGSDTGCSLGAGGKQGEAFDDDPEEVLVSILKRGGAASRLSDGGGGAVGSVENEVVGGFVAAVRGLVCIEVSVTGLGVDGKGVALVPETAGNGKDDS